MKCSRTGRTASRQSLDGRLCCQRAVRDWVRMPEVSWFPPGLDRVQNPRPGGGSHEAEVRELRAKIGELVLELDARKKLAALSGKPETAFCWCRA